MAESGTSFRPDNSILLWGKETTWGTAATQVVSQFGLLDSADMPDPDIGIQSFYGVGSGRNRWTVLKGPWDLRTGLSNIQLQADTAADVLAMPIGTNNSSTITEGLTAHDQRINSYTIKVAMYSNDGSYPLVRQYVGGKVNRATIHGSEGDVLRMNLDEMIFKDIQHNLTGTAKSGLADYTGNAMVPSDAGRWTYAGASIKFGANGTFKTICSMRSFSLSIDNQLRPRHYMCRGSSDSELSQVINDLQEGKRQYGIQVGIDVLDENTDLVLFQYLMDQSATVTGTSTGPTTGFQVVGEFHTTPGEAPTVANLVLTCATNPSANNPGVVVKSGKINLPPPPEGVFPADYTLDASDVKIVISAI